MTTSDPTGPPCSGSSDRPSSGEPSPSSASMVTIVTHLIGAVVPIIVALPISRAIPDLLQRDDLTAFFWASGLLVVIVAPATAAEVIGLVKKVMVRK